MKLIRLSTIIFLQLSLLNSQPIPNDYFIYHSKKLLFDAGSDWNLLSNFRSPRFNNRIKEQKPKTNLPLHIKGQIGLLNQNNVSTLYMFSHFNFNDYFYGFIYPRYTNKIEKHHSPEIIPGFNNLQDNHSGLGYQNAWVALQIGKGVENWGAGNDIQLALSEYSEPYDYFLLASDYGKFRVKYINGYLESIDNNINRYITARGIEWSNRRSIVIGFSETVIYSGENRSLDIGYLNPMSSHLEVELNDRLNIIGDSHSNAVWQLHIDLLLGNNIRLSGNYLFDEFVFDPEIEIGKEHGRAWSLRSAITPMFSSNHLLTIYGKIIYVGTPTFRHAIGANNFVQNERPLGWYKGSDSVDLSLGLNYFNRHNLILSIETGFLKSGEDNIIHRVYNPYSDYLKGPFPSGVTDETIYLDTYFIYYWKHYASISSGLKWSEYLSNGNKLNFRIRIQLFHNFSSVL